MYDIEAAIYPNPRYHYVPEFYPKNVRHRGEAFRGGKAGIFLQGVIDLYDAEGYRITEHRGQLLACLTLKSSTATGNGELVYENVLLSRCDDGSYTVSYLVKTAGTWSLAITNEHFEHIDGSPFEVEITVGEVSADKSALTYVEQVGFVSNYKEFFVHARDSFGNDAKEGGAPFAATCLGGGKMVSLDDCRDGKEPDPYADVFETVERCRDVFLKNSEIQTNFNALRDSLEKMQRETYTSYNAARLRVVHSIPAVFSINEPSKEEQLAKRKQLVNDYRELNEQLAQIETNLQNLQNLKNEVNDYLLEKTKMSRRLYKEAVDAYNKSTGRVLRLARDSKRAQNLRRSVREGSPDAFRKLEEAQRLGETLKLLRESDQTVKREEETTREQEEEDMLQEGTRYKLNQTMPDRPNTLAFWLMEGRFRPPRGPK